MNYGGSCASIPYFVLLRFVSSFCGSLFVNLRFHWILGQMPVNGPHLWLPWGFRRLAGRFARDDRLRFGVPMTGEIRFTRLDTGKAVELVHRPQAVPRPATLSALMHKALTPGADMATRKAFADVWQGWVRTMLVEHADDPALISVVN